MNVKGVLPYIEAAHLQLPRMETHQVSVREAMEDFMMVGLRLLRGVRSAEFAAQFGAGEKLEAYFGSELERLIKQGLLERTPQADGYRLTRDGIMFGNEVFGAFLGTRTG